MAKYGITGIWVNQNEVITHYAFHTIVENSISKATKTAKAVAIALLEQPGNTATTVVWNYNTAGWKFGENVTVVNGTNGKYLRSNPDNKLTDNLKHLIDFDSIGF